MPTRAPRPTPPRPTKSSRPSPKAAPAAARTRTTRSPAAQLEQFIDRHTPELAADGRAVLATMRKLLPGAIELVYDNWQWLVVGFGPSERASEAILSVVFAPRWITICFLQNSTLLNDPEGLLRGSGKVVRSVRLVPPIDIGSKPVRALVLEARGLARVPLDPKAGRRVAIRAIHPNPKPRRPAAKD